MDYTRPTPGYIDLNLLTGLDRGMAIDHFALSRAIQPAVTSGTIWRTLHSVVWTASAGIELGFIMPTEWKN